MAAYHSNKFISNVIVQIEPNAWHDFSIPLKAEIQKSGSKIHETPLYTELSGSWEQITNTKRIIESNISIAHDAVAQKTSDNYTSSATDSTIIEAPNIMANISEDWDTQINPNDARSQVQDSRNNTFNNMAVQHQNSSVVEYIGKYEWMWMMQKYKKSFKKMETDYNVVITCMEIEPGQMQLEVKQQVAGHDDAYIESVWSEIKDIIAMTVSKGSIYHTKLSTAPSSIPVIPGTFISQDEKGDWYAVGFSTRSVDDMVSKVTKPHAPSLDQTVGRSDHNSQTKVDKETIQTHGFIDNMAGQHQNSSVVEYVGKYEWMWMTQKYKNAFKKMETDYNVVITCVEIEPGQMQLEVKKQVAGYDDASIETVWSEIKDIIAMTVSKGAICYNRLSTAPSSVPDIPGTFISQDETGDWYVVGFSTRSVDDMVSKVEKQEVASLVKAVGGSVYNTQSTSVTSQDIRGQQISNKLSTNRTRSFENAYQDRSMQNTLIASVHADTTDKTAETQFMMKQDSSMMARVKHKPTANKNNFDISSDSSVTSPAGITVVSIQGTHIHIINHDITKLAVEAIVNVTDSTMSLTTGMSKAVADAAGSQIREHCRKYIYKHKYITVGNSHISPGYDLPCTYVVHTYVPMKGYNNDHSILRNIVDGCFRTASDNNWQSYAIPALGSGFYGFLPNESAAILKEGIAAHLKDKCQTSLKDIVLVTLDGKVASSLESIFLADTLHFTSRKPAFDKFVSPHVKRSNNSSTSRFKNMTLLSDEVDGPSKPFCSICRNDINGSIKRLKCGHTFCQTCIDRWFRERPTCPQCVRRYGPLIGHQPKGTMSKKRQTWSLSGFDKCGTIIITYDIPHGIQTQEHPNPGTYYDGTLRTAYLPDNREGQEVYSLLKKAFDARLVFTIGQSVTSGMDNAVIWNDIHHKTNVDGGPHGYGYPDPTYLSRVKAELAAKGIM